MMKIIGLIVEYNPFHNGHAYHLSQVKKIAKADALIAIMSGPFVQRGEPAIANKWTRAEMALRAGVDVVFELPFLYATQSAEWFAYGAVKSFHDMGIVDGIGFGMESQNSDWLMALTAFLEEEPEEFSREIKNSLSLGSSYPSAFASALSKIHHPVLKEIPIEEQAMPNNLLALHYCRSLLRLKSKMVPFPILRKGAEHHQQETGGGTIASATALRQMLQIGNLEKIKPYVPRTTYVLLLREKEAGRFPVFLEPFYPYLLHQLITREAEELAQIHEMKEGIHHLIRKVGMTAGSYSALVEQMGSKRYTHSRIRRLLLYVLMNVTCQKIEDAQLLSGPSYLRVLGFTKKGKEVLKELKKGSSLPVIQQVKKERNPQLEMDLRASRLYSLGFPNQEMRESSRRG